MEEVQPCDDRFIRDYTTANHDYSHSHSRKRGSEELITYAVVNESRRDRTVR